MSGEEAAEIHMWRLHYGKLAAGSEKRIPDSQGYAVTRRSFGLPPEDDASLSPARLIGVKRLEPDVLDHAAGGAGCLVIRTDGERVALLRSRFRPEDGDHGHGRLYQQSAVWIAHAQEWRRHPAALLAIAGADVMAEPDALEEEESARLGEAPACYRVDSLAEGAVLEALEKASEETPWALPMLDFLAEGAETGADATLTFGAHDFACESDFLAGVGLALQLLNDSYPRWDDISVVSGLRHTLPGLCLRYLPTAEIVEAETSVAA